MFANEIWPLDIANIAPTIAGKALSRKRLVGTTSHLHNLKVNRNKTVPTFTSRLLIVPCGDLVEEYANFKIRLSKNLWYNRAWDPRHMDMLGEDEDDGDA
ncbi:hypothetical protein F2Q70_00012166 [Brassica cretica]|uniref:Uncharacterized protein n=1 Tax=Brassica cretica TaxID=69181 RepID=A0A8S9M4C5_BRACR|nr:hypothetical protein F2Q70_00012166 [Brassica cretica]